MTGLIRSVAISAACAGAWACSSSDSVTVNGNPAAGGNAGAGTAQLPPVTNSKDVEAWLLTRQYRNWQAEPAIHASRSPSPHGFDKVYSNDAISAMATGTGAWPAGAANVKELYNAVTDTTPGGYAVMVKTGSDSAGGANWFFYERTVNGTVAAAGDLNDHTCVPCHSAAGSDAAHTPTDGGRDFVYTAVP